MLQNEMIKRIRSWKGQIHVCVNGKDNIYWVRVYKNDLIDVIRHSSKYDLSLSEKDGILYVDRSY